MPTADSYERAAIAKAAQQKADQKASLSAFKESGMSVSGYIKKVDAQAEAAAKAKADAAAAKAKADAAAKAKAAADKAAKELAARQAAANAIRNSNNSTANNSTSTSETEGTGASSKPEVVLYESVSTVATTATAASVETPDIKIATSNLFIFEDIALTPETMTDLVFEDIGGRELIDIVSGDMVYDLATQAAPNQPIKNLSSIVERYSPKNLINLQGTSDKFFQSNFQIDINSYIPLGSDVSDNPHVYIVTPETSSDSVNEKLLDHLVIEVINVDVANNERVEVQILSYEDLYDDTIY